MTSDTESGSERCRLRIVVSSASPWGRTGRVWGVLAVNKKPSTVLASATGGLKPRAARRAPPNAVALPSARSVRSVQASLPLI